MTKEIVLEAKSLVKGKWWKFIGVMLLVEVMCMGAGFILGAIFGGALGLAGVNTQVISGLAGFLGGILGSIFGLGLAKYFYDARNGEEKLVTVFWAWAHFTSYLKFFVSSLVIAATLIVFFLICGIFGALFALIPVAGPIFAFLFGFAALVVYVIYLLHYVFMEYKIFEGYGPVAALKESKKVAKGHKWAIFWSPIRLVWIPLVIILVGYAISFIVAFTSLSTGVTVLLFILAIACFGTGLVWSIILIPASMMIMPALYKKLNGSDVVLEEVKE